MKFWFGRGAERLTDPVSGRRLYPIPGGVHFSAEQYHKAESNGTPIAEAPLPSHYVVPLRASSRFTARPIVEVGVRVLAGQALGQAEGPFGVAAHAPTSGWVRDIGEYTLAHPSGLSALAVVIEPDGKHEPAEPTPYRGALGDIEAVRTFLQGMGLAGLGGAAFPSHVKVASGQVRTLILNGAECEPWITCDDRLMREHPDEIVAGAQCLAAIVQAQEVLIAIEDNKPEAIAAMRQAAQCAGGITVVAVPTLYPAGGEKQLIERLTGIEVPYGRLAAEFGVLVFNVGTARSIYRAVTFGEPLTHRVVTLTGAAAQRGNWWVGIGHPVAELLPLMQPFPDVNRYLVGGPMTGFPLPNLDAPVGKGVNCLIAANDALFPPPQPEQPCIRCGRCAEVCPVRLEPMLLYWHAHAKQFGAAQELHLFDCIECGCCSYVCPAHIPLVDYFRFAKSEIWARERETAKASEAKERFEFRNYRLEREKAEKAARAAAKAAETRRKLEATAAGSEPGTNGDAEAIEAARKKALIEAAMARAKAARAASEEGP